ncbi:MAG: MarC family protein [Capnocytophaga sp.]|nr:MarC family protein [Capnocytophaga sp.]
MDQLFTFSLSVFTGLFAITNPITNVPVFLGVVEDKDDAAKKRIAKKACLTAFVLLTAFILLGKYIFELFDITIPSFKITGGLLIFYVGFEMILSKKSTVKNSGIVEDTDDSVAITPLAIPFIAGPGTIVTAMNFVSNVSYVHLLITILIAAIVIGMNHIAFSFSRIIVKRLGKNVITVLGKIMGLIIAIIGTNMFIQGLKMTFDI